jgi:hypothetical protein
MLETLNLTTVSVTLIIVIGIMWFFSKRSRIDENSVKAYKNKIKVIEEERDEYAKQHKTWQQRYYRLQKQVDEGFDLEGDTSTDDGMIGIIQKFLPMIGEVFPQAKGLLGDPDTIKIFIDALRAHPDLLQKIVPALLKKKGKNTEQKQLSDKEHQSTEKTIQESYRIVS